MMMFVVPQITTIFEETGADLPILTRIVIGTSNFLLTFWWLMVLLAIAGGVSGVRFLRTAEGRRAWDLVLLNIPIFKKLFQKIYLARFSENLGTLIKGGIPIIHALEITGDVVGNTVYKDTIKEAALEVEKGGEISGVLKENKYIPMLVVQMVSVGEDTGKLDVILAKIASFYQRDVDDMVNNMTSLIQPILILILGAAAGVLVAAILLPIYNLSSSF
jgi:type II secretory pathway component PulF